MHDVVGAYQRLDRIYQLYIKSAFPLRYRTLAAERDDLLKQPAIVSQPPLIEPIPTYSSSGKDLQAAAKLLPLSYRELAQLGQMLLEPGIELYDHQWQSLQQVLVNQKDLVVTTGTGSGKTECFLLPLLAHLAWESSTWEASPPPPNNHQWWDGAGNRVCQWEHLTRPKALRALILYPLNALVEDQLRRLRKALEAPKVHNWLDRQRGGNRITFGRYTGQTPLPGEQTPDKVKRLRYELREREQQRQQILQANSSLNPDLPYYFPRLDGGEIWSRWDMQDYPPDILITNYSMLNIMMMRSIENNIFDATRDWLSQPNHPERQFFLIIDELHAYRGTPGTEVAYILRLLFSRLGLTPDSPKLRILTTTASLEDNAEGKKFLREFFGRDDTRFAFITGQQQQPKPNARKSLVKYQSAFADFAQSVQPDPFEQMKQPDPIENTVRAAMSTLAKQLGYSASDRISEEQQLGEAMAASGAGDALRDACFAVNGSVRATNVKDLDKQLFPSCYSGAFVSDSMRGLLLALGMSKLGNGRSPQPVRGHLFFHNLQSLWACCNPDCTQVDQNQRKIDLNSPIGAIHATHRLSCSCGSRVLDLIVCEVCGDVFLGGYKTTRKLNNIAVDILTPDQPDLEGIPDRVVLNQRYSNYRVFWSLPGETPAWTTQPQDSEWTVNKIKRKWVKAKLNKTTGLLIQNSTPPKADEIPGWLYQVDDNQKDQPALPTKCPRCDADYSRRDKFRTPLRIHRTGFQKACQVLASGLLREMSVESRKLVIFSDSRQDAAKLAAGMELDHYRDMVRLLLIQSFYQYWSDLVAFLQITTAANPASQGQLQTLNFQLSAAVAQAPLADDIFRRDRFVNANPTLVTEALSWVMGLSASNQEVRNTWLALLQRYPERIPLLELRQKVRDALLECGICPGGSSFHAMNYSDGQNQAQQRHPWFKCYNWTGNLVTKIFPATQAQTDHANRLEDMLTDELMYPLFAHMVRTMEGFGQGWVSYQPQGNPSPKLIEATSAVIRQLGIRHRHRYSRFFHPGTDSNLPGYAQQYIQCAGLKPEDIQQQLLQSQAAISGSGSLVLDPNKLYLVLPPEKNQNGSRSGYRCDRCNAFYLHPTALLCPECNSDRRSSNKNPQRLAPGTTTCDFDYYTYLSEESGQPFRMNAAELTGQTDRDERSKRQRWFQDIFINDEISRVQGIDLLSVTTTMEAGVDIGALLAVMMANMPPRRFNYQQRVGRAGRRSAGVALAVTFCRGRSHDDFYFQRPESITGDPPPQPYVDMNRREIFDRVLIKEVLRQAFAFTGISATNGSDNVHGEFGNVTDWVTYKSDIQDWLHDPTNEPAILSVLNTLREQTNLSNASVAQMLDELRHNLIPAIQFVVDDPTYTQDKLSERLANAGLLPMFGFPTRVRLLYTRLPSRTSQWPPEAGVVDRDLDVALSQFAPGSQTVKDKAVYTACGVVELYLKGGKVESKSGLVPELPKGNQSLGLCLNCQAVVYPHKLLNKPLPGNQQPSTDKCSVCGVDALRSLDAREPKGFFTDLKPEDFDGQFEWQPRSTRPSLRVNAAVSTPQQILNASVSGFSDHIISVNDNGGVGGFDFQNALIYGKPKPGAYAVSPDNNDSVTTSGAVYRVALLSRRKTDILLVNIQQWSTGVFADPTTVMGRAAWYSFAFWLRVASGTLLDVDAMELQAGFRSLAQNGTVIGQAFLCDQLENGAGYCRFLAQPNEFQKLMALADPTIPNSIATKWMRSPHGSDCDTSCNLCLRDYQNLAYHGLLDWRLALDMARLVSNPTAVIDLNTPWGTVGNPWTNLYQAQAPIPATLQRLGYSLPIQFQSLNGYVHQNHKRKTLLILRHPLWQDNHPEWIAAVASAKAQYPDYQVESANPFMIIRRPGDYA